MGEFPVAGIFYEAGCVAWKVGGYFAQIREGSIDLAGLEITGDEIFGPKCRDITESGRAFDRFGFLGTEFEPAGTFGAQQPERLLSGVEGESVVKGSERTLEIFVVHAEASLEFESGGVLYSEGGRVGESGGGVFERARVIR
jgi:hypothetical protein